MSKTRKKDRAETLWDLELEKENEDRLKEAEHMTDPMPDDDSGRKRRQSADFNIPTNQNLIAQISSTGILLKPLDTIQSTLDFAFVLNVRESELYPPLLLADDLKCLEDKVAIYQNEFTSGEISKTKQKISLIQCSQLQYEIFVFFSNLIISLIFQNMPKLMWKWRKSNFSKNV